MTDTTQAPARSEVERAVSFGVRAPSIHNTQPWRWVYRAGVLELHADRSRQLPALDPDGRSVLLSCGAALELARLGFAAAGWRTEVDRLPDEDDPDLLARIRTVSRAAVESATVERAEAAERRHTERRPFLVEPVADAAIRSVLAAATDTGVYAYAVQRADEKRGLRPDLRRRRTARPAQLGHDPGRRPARRPRAVPDADELAGPPTDGAPGRPPPARPDAARPAAAR